jgi:hypothetical protein
MNRHDRRLVNRHRRRQGPSPEMLREFEGEWTHEKSREFQEALSKAFEAKGLDPNPPAFPVPSLEYFDVASEVAARFGLLYDTGKRGPDGQIIWGRSHRYHHR